MKLDAAFLAEANATPAKISIIIEWGKESHQWYARSSSFPEIEGSGATPYEALQALEMKLVVYCRSDRRGKSLMIERFNIVMSETDRARLDA